MIIVGPLRPILERLMAARRSQDSAAIAGAFRRHVEPQQLLNSVDWPRLVTKLGWPGFRFHDLRGTAISQWTAAGVPLTTVPEMAGHASILSTNLYARTADNALTAARKLVEGKNLGNAVALLDSHPLNSRLLQDWLLTRGFSGADDGNRTRTVSLGM